MISSMAIWRPFLMASPEAAEPPDTAAVRPILMGSPAWDAEGRTQPIARTSNRSVMRRMETSFSVEPQFVIA